MNIDLRLALVGLLLLLLLLSAGISYQLIKRNRHLTRELARTLLDPLNLDDFKDQPMLEENMDTTTLLFFGDSRAAAWPNPVLGESFVFVNRGINGQSSAQAALRFGAHVAPVQPDVVVVQVCVNDLWRIPALPDEKEAIIAACQENISQIVEKSKALGATIILTTVFPVQDPPVLERMYWSSDIYDGIDLVNETIRSLAGDRVLVLDAYGLLVDKNSRLQDQYAADYLHINEVGYQMLNEALINLLKEREAQ